MEKPNQPDALDRALTHLLQAELPTEYRDGWREAIQREERNPMKAKSNAKPLWRIALATAAALVLVIGALSAGRLFPAVVTDTLYDDAAMSFDNGGEYGGEPLAAASDGNYAPAPSLTMSAQAPAASGVNRSAADTGTAMESAPEAKTSTSSAEGGEVSGTKIVRTADLTIASTSFDTDVEALTRLTQQLGGYVSSVNVSGEASRRKDRVAYYSLRIPSDRLDEFLTGVEGIGRVTSRYETATDMTTQYSDTQMRLTTQQTKLERLNELLKQATDVSDLLEIENEIANTQYTLDQLESSLRTIDRNVERSDVSVTLQEQSAGDTAQTVELTLWQRIGSGFEASVSGLAAFGQNLLVFLAMLLPALIPLTLLAAALWLILRARRRGKARRAKESPEGFTAAETAYTVENRADSGAPTSGAEMPGHGATPSESANTQTGTSQDASASADPSGNRQSKE